MCACVHVRNYPVVGHVLRSSYHPMVLYKGTVYMNMNLEHGKTATREEEYCSDFVT